MEKYIEIYNGKQIDRYYIKGISINEFIDYIVKDTKGNIKQIKDISKEEFEGHKNRQFCFEFNVEDRFYVTHYISKHESGIAEKEWNHLVNPEYRLWRRHFE